MSTATPTIKVDTLTAKQRAVAEPIVRAMDRLLSGPISPRDRAQSERLILANGAQLYRMRRDLESALSAEDDRLRTEGTTDELDERWNRNLRRLEVICDLLDQAKAAAPRMKAVAA